MSYDDFSHYGIKICAGFDKQKEIVGKTINYINDYDFSKISEYSKKNNIEVAIFCVPIEEAKDVAN
jgi:NADH/NAD ratio-sensing transcriptional regulator Rex